MNQPKNILEETGLSGDEQAAILRILISPLIVMQAPVTLLDAAERIRSTEHTWAFDCLMPDFQSWKEHLPDEQITWLGDDCARLAPTIAEKAFPDLTQGIALAIQSLGTDNPRVLADGIFEYAKNKVSLLEASLFTFGVIQLLRRDQFAFKS
jgi:hypothetical protein